MAPTTNVFLTVELGYLVVYLGKILIVHGHLYGCILAFIIYIRPAYAILISMAYQHLEMH